ncbi:hypothetical protein LPJ78_004368 [Coemansia sp. RSA 989]|nr:hypothetical protein LPJ68_003731 [Coemansia sp. RSA 1086]KAJ1862967.1 hypothetical protein LPJ78_004368 [Coemansia sp. RSA 989]KAJ1870753.1 hypothetical protein LPJ55_004414 [Coemansia sp. RSA 990]KAJ2668317.1 hypothetical protein IWW42_005289 [Coemansia sp. RSA 1085]
MNTLNAAAAAKKDKRLGSLKKFFGKPSDTSNSTPEKQASSHNAGTSEQPTMPSKPLLEGTQVTFKNGKLGLSEKRLNLERHPAVIAAVFGFHQLIAQLKQHGVGQLPLASIPKEHWPLVAILAQERDVSLAALVKNIETQLCPVVFGDDSTKNSDILSAGAVEQAVLEIAQSRNYGVSLEDIQQHSTSHIDEVPQNLTIHRWEVKDMQLLPKDVQDVVAKRRAQREEACRVCAAWFADLDAETKTQLLAGTLKKLKGKIASSVANQQTEAPATSKEAAATASIAGEGTEKGGMAVSSPRKKQRTLRGQKSLQNFFNTEKHAPSSLPQQHTKNFYRSAFLPFHIRSHTELYRYQIPIDFDPRAIDRIINSQAAESDGLPDTSQLLHEFASASKPSAGGAGGAGGSAMRPAAVPSVCEGIDLDEAELHLIKLRQLPIKLLQFHGCRRPAYFGTWSKRARVVGGRRPFAQETAEIDYDVDSDAEWEADDEEGEELRSDDEDDDDEDDDDEDDGDFDEENGFVVCDGEILSEPRRRHEGEDSDSDGSDFDSEDDVIEIDPDEEVCADSMDIVGCTPPDSATEAAPAPRSKRPKHMAKAKGPSPPQRRKVVPLTPIVIGLAMHSLEQSSSTGPCGEDPHQAIDSKAQHLAKLTVTATHEGISMPLAISTDASDMWAHAKHAEGSSEGEASARKSKDITDKELCQLIDIVHESSLGMARLVEELKRVIPAASKAQCERLIHEHAKKEKRPPATRPMWYVNTELVARLKGTQLASPAVKPSAPSNSDLNAFFSSPMPSRHPAKRQRTNSLECDSR